MSTVDIGQDTSRFSSYCESKHEGMTCRLYVNHYGKHKELPGGDEW